MLDQAHLSHPTHLSHLSGQPLTCGNLNYLQPPYLPRGEGLVNQATGTGHGASLGAARKKSHLLFEGKFDGKG